MDTRKNRSRIRLGKKRKRRKNEKKAKLIILKRSRDGVKMVAHFEAAQLRIIKQADSWVK